MPLTSAVFGHLPDGRRVDRFVLANASVRVGVCAYGAAVTNIATPDRAGNWDDICAGFPSLAPYVATRTFFGAVIGRVANRVGGGCFRLDGKEYRLACNDGGAHHLHGGRRGFDTRLWDAAVDNDGLRLDYRSPDGEEGYPGELAVTVRYGLNEEGLGIDYQAVCAAPTLVNLTNHSFFNLNGFRSDVLSHHVQSAADRYLPVDSSRLPTGECASVADTPFDFTAGKELGRDLRGVPAGYDHYFCLPGSGGAGEGAPAVAVRDPASGRTLSMRTDQPGFQLYSGNFLDGSLSGHGGRVYRRRYAFCLEAQKPPDAINRPAFPSVVLRPGEIYRQRTVYGFGREE